MKKRALIAILATSVTALALLCALVIPTVSKQLLLYSKEYMPGTGNIKGDVDTQSYLAISEKFEIGANHYGYAVFKHPEQAFEELKHLYPEGIALIQNTYHLEPLSHNTYPLYGVYGWQTLTGSPEAQQQAKFITRFFDIYENSFVTQ